MIIENIIFPDFLANNYIIRLLVASFLGAIIGVERDIHGRAAGLRTNLLVSLGAALFMLISEQIAITFSSAPDSLIRVDPGRIAAQIVTGIGFLGAGTIIKYGFTVKGLTTAACLWLSAALGMSAGAGYIDLAIVATVVGLAGLILFNLFEKTYAKDTYRVLQIVTNNSTPIDNIKTLINNAQLKILHTDKEIDFESKRMTVSFNVRISQKGITDKIAEEIILAIEELDIPLYNVKWFQE